MLILRVEGILLSLKMKKLEIVDMSRIIFGMLCHFFEKLQLFKNSHISDYSIYAESPDTPLMIRRRLAFALSLD